MILGLNHQQHLGEQVIMIMIIAIMIMIIIVITLCKYFLSKSHLSVVSLRKDKPQYGECVIFIFSIITSAQDFEI